MRPRLKWEQAQRLLHLGLLRSASLMVPGQQRAEWGREWRAELWHVRQACAPMAGISWRGEREVIAFCLGAFQDAVCIRRAGRERRLPFAGMRGTAQQCMLILATVLTASYAAALLLPGVRAERSLWQRKVNPSLVLIEEAPSNNVSQPTILPAQLKTWQGRKQKYFDAFAFYQVTQQSVEQNLPAKITQTQPVWAVARASLNLFTLLGLPIRFEDEGAMTSSLVPEVILSEAFWKSNFSADPHVAGVTLRLGEQTVRIAGVAPDGSLGLPGNVDAWLLEPDADMVPATAGYVVAHLTAMGAEEMWTPCVHITANGPDNSEQDLLGISLEDWKPAPGTLYLFAIFLAILSLPAITSVSLGESSLNPHKTSWSKRVHRWSFFGAKIALLLPIIYFVSLDLAYGCTALGREREAYIQLISTFAMCLFGMRWVLKDQRQRCPVCVRLVTRPAQVGQASRTFLDWNGTEMMCMGGHTLLHVPGMPTSWFSSQRWLYLDTSWNFLFAGSSRHIP